MNAKTSSAGEEEASGMSNETLGEAKRRQVIRVAYVIAALDLTFLFMQFGLMPYLAKSLGLDSVGFGYLQTIFGVLQLVGGYIFGRFADRFGARAALILSCASGSFFFLLMSFSTNIPLLFLSRLPGVFMHGIPGAQKVITDVTTPSQRAGALGKLGFCFGVGIITGSVVGGVLSTKFGVYVPTYVGLVGSLINTLIAVLWIPSQTKPKSDHHRTEHSTSPSGSLFSIREILRLMKFPGVMEVFIVKVFAGLPIGLFMIMFSIISMDFFGLEAVESGYLMSYFGVLQMVVQGLVVGKLASRCSEMTLLRLSVFVFACVGLGMALMRTVWHYCIIAAPLVFAFSMLATITDSILTKAVPPSDTGRKRKSSPTRTCCSAGRMSWWEGSPEPRGTCIHTSTPCQPRSFPKNGGLVPAQIPPFPREGGRKPSRASVRNGPVCSDFIVHQNLRRGEFAARQDLGR